MLSNKTRLIIADVKSNNNHGISTGHYFAVAQNYVDLYSDTFDVKVAGGPIFKQKFSEGQLFKLPYDNIARDNPIKNKWRVLMNCRYLYNHTTKDDIIVLQASGVVTAFLGMLFYAKKYHNIFSIQYSKENINSRIKQFIYQRVKKFISGVICPNSRIGELYQRPFCIVTDYIYSKGKQHYLSYNERNYDFALVGSISPDKGTVEAALYLATFNYKVLIAGKASEHESKILKDLADKNKNIELHLGYVSDQDYSKYIQNSKYCILNYKGCYADRSSGVVLDVIFNGTPILGRQCSALDFIKEYNLGELYKDIKELNVNALISQEKFEQKLHAIDEYLQYQQTMVEKVKSFLIEHA